MISGSPEVNNTRFRPLNRCSPSSAARAASLVKSLQRRIRPNCRKHNCAGATTGSHDNIFCRKSGRNESIKAEGEECSPSHTSLFHKYMFTSTYGRNMEIHTGCLLLQLIAAAAAHLWSQRQTVIFIPPHMRKYHRWSCAAHQKAGRGPAEGQGID